jgi:nitrite reductase/ring-hydroxylating ferredoxin subunit/uncharacterized membrane protein
MPELWNAGWYAAMAGVFGAVLAAIFGAIDLFSVVPPASSARNRGYKHAILNLAALGLFVAIVAYRGSPEVMPNGTSLLLSAVGCALVGASGWLGGTLVYRNQIGVDHRYANAGKQRVREIPRWDAAACRSEELSEGQMLLAEIGGSRVAIGRCSEGFVAFTDRCTHRGGPLSDGALVGCTVQCPWHGSQFDVNTGRVVNGPAEQRIEVYQAEVRNGEVFVFPRPSQTERAA